MQLPVQTRQTLSCQSVAVGKESSLLRVACTRLYVYASLPFQLAISLLLSVQ